MTNYPPQHPPAPQPPAMLTSFPIAMQIRMKRFYGHIFPAAGRLYFVCDKQGGAWAAAIGQGLGGAIGGAIVAMGSATPGQAPGTVDEATVYQAVTQREGSLIMEASQISMIKHTIFWRLIKWNGQTIGLPQGMSKPLRAELARWAGFHNVKTKGLG